MKDSVRINEYFNGMIVGVSLYARWENGVCYVGTTGKTLKKAIEDIEVERKEALNNDNI